MIQLQQTHERYQTEALLKIYHFQSREPPRLLDPGTVVELLDRKRESMQFKLYNFQPDDSSICECRNVKTDLQLVHEHIKNKTLQLFDLNIS